MNSDLLRRDVPTGSISPPDRLAEGYLDDERAAPAIELKREQINLSVAMRLK
jgi:hypothetical protein